MRRLLVLFGLVFIAGCSEFGSLFRAHSDVAAEAGALELSSERLAEILTGPKGVRLNSDAAEFVTTLWLDYALFASAVAEGKLPADSAAVATALWPAIANIKAERWHEQLVSERTSFTDAQLDSLFSGSNYRVFQHILFNVDQTATPEERAAARRQAEAARVQADGGSNFGALASRLSQDPGSARDSGYLPPSQRGQWATSFDSAGWTLAPGQVSPVVETPFGFHVIKRPAFTEARDRLRQTAIELATNRLDSIYFDSLAAARNLEMDSRTASRMREALEDIEGHRMSTERLASYEGGALTVRDFLEWVNQLPPAYQMQIAQMPDSGLVQYARVVAQNELLLAQADSAGVGPTPEEWAQLSQQFQGQVDSLRAEMELGTDVTDSTVALDQRLQVADMKLRSYFDRVVSGQVRMRRLPASLGDVLRDRLEYDLHPAGVQRGLELAQARQAQDTTGGAMQAPPGAPGMPGGAPGMQPAPGPAPSAAPQGAADSAQGS